MNLMPTHKCFDDALDFLSYSIMGGDINLDSPYWLVHALCKMPTGDVAAHAWVERNDDTVITAYIVEGRYGYIEIPKTTFYEWYQPIDITRYTVREAINNNIKHHNYGPWETRYREACGNGDRSTLWVVGEIGDTKNDNKHT